MLSRWVLAATSTKGNVLNWARSFLTLITKHEHEQPEKQFQGLSLLSQRNYISCRIKLHRIYLCNYYIEHYYPRAKSNNYFFSKWNKQAGNHKERL